MHEFRVLTAAEMTSVNGGNHTHATTFLGALLAAWIAFLTAWLDNLPDYD